MISEKQKNAKPPDPPIEKIEIPGKAGENSKTGTWVNAPPAALNATIRGKENSVEPQPTGLEAMFEFMSIRQEIMMQMVAERLDSMELRLQNNEQKTQEGSESLPCVMDGLTSNPGLVIQQVEAPGTWNQGSDYSQYAGHGMTQEPFYANIQQNSM